MSLLTSFSRPTPGVRYPKFASGRFYNTRSFLAGINGTGALTANTIYASPLWIPPGAALDRIGINTTVAAAAGKVARLMLFAAGTDDLPGALLLDAGTVAADAVAGDLLLTIAYTPPPGLIYAAVVCDGTPTLTMVQNAAAPYGFATVAAANYGGSPSKANGGTTAPNPFGAVGAYVTGTYFLVGVRAV